MLAYQTHSITLQYKTLNTELSDEPNNVRQIRLPNTTHMLFWGGGGGVDRALLLTRPPIHSCLTNRKHHFHNWPDFNLSLARGKFIQFNISDGASPRDLTSESCARELLAVYACKRVALRRSRLTALADSIHDYVIHKCARVSESSVRRHRILLQHTAHTRMQTQSVRPLNPAKQNAVHAGNVCTSCVSWDVPSTHGTPEKEKE